MSKKHVFQILDSITFKQSQNYKRRIFDKSIPPLLLDNNKGITITSHILPQYVPI